MAEKKAEATAPKANAGGGGGLIDVVIRSLTPAPSRTPSSKDVKDTTPGTNPVAKRAETDASTSSAAASIPPVKAIAGATGTELAKQWDQVISEAKSERTVIQKLKRLTSATGKDKDKTKDKGKGKAKEEEINIAETIPLPPDGPASTLPIDNDKGKTPGANTLSRRIQLLLSSVPPFLHTVPDSGMTATLPSQGPPLNDAKFLEYLSSITVMNGQGPATGDAAAGGAAGTKPRRSVWDVLDELVPYKPPTTDKVEAEDQLVEEASETSLMVCAPLIPLADSKVEIAQSEVIQVRDEPLPPEIAGSKGVASEVFAALWPGNGRRPWWKRKKHHHQDRDDGRCSPTPTPPPPPPPPTKPVKIWIPSQTELSFQVAWWGYRLWMPPPVMAILSDKTIEATKRAAMVTTAIAWLINNIPIAILPPPLKAAVALLKGVVPLLGYVGGFIAWSWGEIKSFDKGKGVVLSATWLLPIALIPTSWDDMGKHISVGTGDEVPAPVEPSKPDAGKDAPAGGKSTEGTPTTGATAPTSGTKK